MYQRFILLVFGLALGLPFMSGIQTVHAKGAYLDFKIYVYKNPQCAGEPAGKPIEMDASPGNCSSYSYRDSKNSLTEGSNGNVRCEADRVVFDKFPFKSNCTPGAGPGTHGKEIVDYNHSIPVGACQEAPSHDGPVWEKLSGYEYNLDCKKRK